MSPDQLVYATPKTGRACWTLVFVGLTVGMILTAFTAFLALWERKRSES